MRNARYVCGEGHKASKLENDDIRAVPVGADYIMIIRLGDLVDSDGTRTHFRTTELIHKSGGKWRSRIYRRFARKRNQRGICAVSAGAIRICRLRGRDFFLAATEARDRHEPFR